MADTIRFGKVSNIDYETGCMEITYEDRGDSVTDMIPMLANAGYKMPQVGETVAVAHNSNGEEEGIVLGTVWGEKTKPPQGKQNFFRQDFDDEPGKCYFRYDGESAEFHNEGDTHSETKKNKTEKIEGDAELEVKGKLTVKVGSCTVTIQGGTVEIKGGATLSISAPTVSIDGSTVNITGGGGDVQVAGISLINHTHKYTAPVHAAGEADTAKAT